VLLCRSGPTQRVVAFLVDVDRRLSPAGVMNLPMNRRDIGDYLGLTLESVSRALSQLRTAGVLDFIGKSQREIVIRDRQRLASFDCQTSENRPPDRISADT